ncbi:MAG: hypothetical protein WCT12_01115 [Verrucomicrobiota bacterium]
MADPSKGRHENSRPAVFSSMGEMYHADLTPGEYLVHCSRRDAGCFCIAAQPQRRQKSGAHCSARFRGFLLPPLSGSYVFWIDPEARLASPNADLQ